MFKFNFVYVLLSISFFNITGCKKKTENNENKDADVKYGFSGQDENSFWKFLGLYEKSLMELTPNDNILVCGKNNNSSVKIAIEVLKEWLIASGREGLRVEKATDCVLDAKAKIEVINDKRYCTKNKNSLGYHSQSGQIHTIVVCDKALTNGKLPKTIFHEIGHAFGLCDQFEKKAPEQIAFNADCKSDFKSENAKKSVMNAITEDSPSELTEDDLLASKINACRSAEPANSVWMKKTKILDTWKNDGVFIEELKRLKTLELDIIPECLEILNSQNSTKDKTEEKTKKDEMEEDETEEKTKESDKSSITEEKSNYGM